MKEIPMIFQGWGVRAIGDGTKTMTRRIKFNGQPGDRIWVKETFAFGLSNMGGIAYHATSKWDDFEDGTPDNFKAIKWRPSIFMPRWASRYLLEVLSVREECIQDISDDDAEREGVDITNASIPGFRRERFRKVWDSINQAQAALRQL